MNEIIYRQDAIDALWEPYDRIREISARMNRPIDGAFGYFISAIKNVPAAEPWTPVEVGTPQCIIRFPDIGMVSEPVLVTYEAHITGEPITAEQTAIYAEADGKWYWYDDYEGNTEPVRVKISAWMELPAPYREAGQ